MRRARANGRRRRCDAAAIGVGSAATGAARVGFGGAPLLPVFFPPVTMVHGASDAKDVEGASICWCVHHKEPAMKAKAKLLFENAMSRISD